MTAHVLFVDDDESNLMVWETAFSSRFPVLIADGAERALALLRTHEVGVVLADQRMPGTTGIELLEAVRNEFPDTIRVLITAYADLNAAVDAINRGHVRRYLRKPCALGELRAEIEDALELYSIRGHARAMERRLLSTERVYALGLVASGLGRELGRPAELIRESVTLARTEAREMAERLDPTKEDLRRLRSKLEEMEGWLGRALSGVERVLDLARSVELRPQGSDPEQVDVGAVLQLALRIVRGELRRGADVELDIRDVRKARGDAGKLGQVILNLLVNALEAVTTVPAGHGVITVRLSAERGVVRLDVMDNGPTIDKGDLATVFDPFRRPGKCPRGGGLGLAISKTLVEEMGGKLHVENMPKGVLFRVSLPEADPRG